MPNPVRPDLRVLCWEGYDSQRILGPFADRHGVTCGAETLLSDARAVRRLKDAPAGTFDVINLNNPFARHVLHPDGIIRPVVGESFAGAEPTTAWPAAAPFFDCAFAADGVTRLGICQRFGPFNTVVNTLNISTATAADQGFSLAADPALQGRYGVLFYEDFTVFHVCIAAGLDPFQPMTDDGFERFSRTAEAWFEGAALVSDNHDRLNTALAAGDIDVYLGGGRYTVAHARLAGADALAAVTPTSGPIGGKGAIAFVEVTSVAADARDPVLAEALLAYMLEPGTAYAAAFETGLCNPVAQMRDPAVFAKFTVAQLRALQWETLDQELERCAPYQIAPDYNALLERLRAARSRRQTV